MRNSEAFALACRLLGRRSMSLRELSDALIAKGIPADAAAEACSQAEELRLCDDLDYAQTLVRRYTARMQGKNAIRMRLKAHGLEAREIEAALSDWEPDYDGLIQLLQTRLEGETDYAAIQRAGTMLYRRGFSSDEISQVLAMYTEACSQTEDDFGFEAFPED